MAESAHTQKADLIFGLVLATGFWFELFRWRAANFWWSMAVFTALLSIYSVWRKPRLFFPKPSVKQTLLIGLVSASLLYAFFWAGNWATSFLPFQAQQIQAVYQNKQEASFGIILLLMVLFIGPGEEIFWRGFVQSTLEDWAGNTWGWLLASALYAAIHILTGNVMLIGAAATAGLFWGWLYLRYKNLYANILSHVLWDVAIFLIWPIH
ncbi:MAG: CPBP family intramembrane metalloprotease [Calditrichaeota bacterium]|nr:CPBP family intramembrane metalloprotease [Calditrichota bacterium]